MGVKENIQQGKKIVNKVSSGIDKIYETKNKYVDKINKIEKAIKDVKLF